MRVWPSECQELARIWKMVLDIINLSGICLHLQAIKFLQDFQDSKTFSSRLFNNFTEIFVIMVNVQVYISLGLTIIRLHILQKSTTALQSQIGLQQEAKNVPNSQPAAPLEKPAPPKGSMRVRLAEPPPPVSLLKQGLL